MNKEDELVISSTRHRTQGCGRHHCYTRDLDTAGHARPLLSELYCVDRVPSLHVSELQQGNHAARVG